MESLKCAGRQGAREQPRARWTRAVIIALVCLSTTAGCAGGDGAGSEIAGFAAGSAAGLLTANPFIAVATGMATRFGASEAGAYLDRRRQAEIHKAIATSAGAADEDQIVDWSVEIDFPPGHAHGQVQTTRSLNGQIACREVLYSVKSSGEASFFVGVICRHSDGEWRWAVSEPTAQRW
ncbi:MAG: hypothetical protein JNM75_06300 [Rhodospirillales bacterium]|nr:hypothetical protein [Rhodospirillales bacterium]